VTVPEDIRGSTNAPACIHRKSRWLQLSRTKAPNLNTPLLLVGAREISAAVDERDGMHVTNLLAVRNAIHRRAGAIRPNGAVAERQSHVDDVLDGRFENSHTLA
jgi:hypothetical protein